MRTHLCGNCIVCSSSVASRKNWDSSSRDINGYMTALGVSAWSKRQLIFILPWHSKQRPCLKSSVTQRCFCTSLCAQNFPAWESRLLSFSSAHPVVQFCISSWTWCALFIYSPLSHCPRKLFQFFLGCLFLMTTCWQTISISSVMDIKKYICILWSTFKIFQYIIIYEEDMLLNRSILLKEGESTEMLRQGREKETLVKYSQNEQQLSKKKKIIYILM